MQDFEKLGLFYLGREYDVAAGKRLDGCAPEPMAQIGRRQNRVDVVLELRDRSEPGGCREGSSASGQVHRLR